MVCDAGCDAGGDDYLVDATAVQEVAEEGLGVQGCLVEVNALGLRDEDGAEHACGTTRQS